MILYFENGEDKRRKIADVPDEMDKTGSLHFIMNLISGYCKMNKMSCPYIRLWKEERDGREVSVFDFGSHSEFFILDPAKELL